MSIVCLVIMHSPASFAVPSLIRMPGRIYMLASHIYRINAAETLKPVALLSFDSKLFSHLLVFSNSLAT